jgi:hypothetical protein
VLRQGLRGGVLALVIALTSACASGSPTTSPSSAAPALTSAATPVATTASSLPQRELPDCEALARTVPASIADRATVERPDPDNARDDAAHSSRLCVIAGRSAQGHRRTFVIRVLRIFADSYLGTPRQRYLLDSARSDVENRCENGWYRLSGFEWSTACYQPADDGGLVRIGVVASNTAVVVGGSGRFEDGEDPAQLRKRVKRDFLAVTRGVLTAVER